MMHSSKTALAVEDTRLIGFQVCFSPGQVPAFDTIVRDAKECDGLAWNMITAYLLGRIHGKREERARRRPAQVNT